MKKIFKSIICAVLVISMLIAAVVPAFAAETEEEYISELRLVYAKNYKEAKDIIAASEFKDYKILRENLNEDTGNVGVWIAYKTTTDIEDAITDISVMQMCGGYKTGNYQEMIQNSYESYVKMGDTYLKAINYFLKGYNAGHFLSKSAYRQLNFYNVVSEGVPTEKIPAFEGERLGDIFKDGITKYELATMFFEGNLYALQNIRSLIAMGVSYNEDGKTYLDKVEIAAANTYLEPCNDRNYDELAALIAPSITVIKDMLKELANYESEFNYTDDEFTDKEISHAENKAIADMLREVDYINGKTLYQFCLDFVNDKDDYSSLYPLVTALNDGQIAMTQVAHYYDVIRYSMSTYPEDLINSEIEAQEEIYSESPFNVYSGVDRSIYGGTFALTNNAYRSDVYGEGDYIDALFGDDRGFSSTLSIVGGAVGTGLFVWAIVERGSENASIAPAAAEAAKKAAETVKSATDAIASKSLVTNSLGSKISVHMASGWTEVSTYGDLINALFIKHHALGSVRVHLYSTFEKYQMLVAKSGSFARDDMGALKLIHARFKEASNGELTSLKAYKATVDAGTASHFTSNVLFAVGGIVLLVSALNMFRTVYNYYHPDFEDVPLALVDMINTVDGDRYIKYDVVYNAETNSDGVYEAADLNAFEGERWNALYYTKSYEAGKPLLADGFSLSNRNNTPKDNYAPVHRFGEVVCYDLNKYNFDCDTNIFLSVKQSKNDKAAVADVPEVVGSMFSAGMLVLSGGIGLALGVGGTITTQRILKKKRDKTGDPDASSEDTSEA